MIHKIGAPGGPNQTYWCCDQTRKVVIEKYDFVEEYPQGPDGPVVRKPQSLTHIWALDASMVDSGSGMETANLSAHGPGLLETRPVPDNTDNLLKDVPPDRTAVWQDFMIMKNLLGPDQKIIERKVVLKGNPKVVDRVQQQQIDAVDMIAVWLAPKPPESGQAKGKTARPASTSSSAQPRNDGTSAQGGSFQIQRLLALRDVHLVAPSKNLTAREQLDADFKESPARRPPRHLLPRLALNPPPGLPHSRPPQDRTRIPTSRKTRRRRRRNRPNPRWSHSPTASKPTS